MTDHQTTPPEPERMEFNVPPFYDTPTAYVRRDLYDDQAARIAELEAAFGEISGVGFDAPMTWGGTDEDWERHRANIMQGIARTALKGTDNG
jgi:hypothetical protein